MTEDKRTLVQVIVNEVDAAIQVNESNRRLEQRAWNLYAGIDDASYDAEDKQQAAAQNKQLMNINFIRPKVNANSGSLLRNIFDADFVPVDETDNDATIDVKKMWLSDKEMMDWDLSYIGLVHSGSIHRGVEEMYIDKKYHPLGNIAFRSRLPGTVVFDPTWKSDSAKDCQVCYDISMLTASQIMEKYPETKKNFFLQSDADYTDRNGENYNDTDMSVTPTFDEVASASRRNRTYRVIRKFEMVTEQVTIEYNKKTGKDLPVGGDYAAKLAFLHKDDPSWEVSDITFRVENKRVCMVTTVCAEIDNNKPLERKPCAIQVGRIPFFPWSVSRVNGVDTGIPTWLDSVQTNINYRETLITNLIENESHGSKLTDPMLFGDDEALKRDFDENFNNINRNFWTAPGALAQGLAPQPIKKSQFPQDVRDQLLRLIDYPDRISGVPAVFDARSEKSGESGYLFAQKTRAAEQQNYLPTATLKQHLNEKAEAWLEQAKIQYTIAGLPRLFRLNGGKDFVLINKTDSGTGRISNDFTKIPRHKIIVSESPASTTSRMIARAVANETLRVIPIEMFGTRTVMSSIMTSGMDGLSSKNKQDLEEFADLEKEQAKAILTNKILSMQLQNKQLEAQLKAPAAPPASTGAPGELSPMAPAPTGIGTDGAPIDAAKSLGYSDGGMP